MKHLGNIFILLTIVIGSVFSQTNKYQKIAESQLPEEGSFVENFPQNKLNGGASKLYLAFTNDYSTINCYGKIDENTYIYYSSIDVDFIINFAKLYECTYRNDSIIIGSEMPFSAHFISGIFKWKNDKLIFLNSDESDPSWTALELGDSLLAKGDIAGAIQAYHAVMYPMHYFDEKELANKILTIANTKALELYKNKQYKESVKLIEDAFTFYGNSQLLEFYTIAEMKDYLQYTPDSIINQFLGVLGDYGLYLLRAGEIDKCIEINEYLTMLSPDMFAPYLQLGDAYLAKNQEQKAIFAWMIYSELKSKTKNPKIPEKVTKLLEKQKGKVVTYDNKLGDFNEVINALNSGDVIRIKPGIYKSAKEVWIANKSNIMIVATGDVEFLCSSPDENVMWISGSNNVIIKGIKAKHTKPSTGESCVGNVIAVDTSDDVTIEYCDLNGCGRVGVYTFSANNLTLYKNIIHDNSQSAIEWDGNQINKETKDNPALKFISNRMWDNGLKK